MRNLLAKAIWIVNSDPPHQLRDEFYQIKNKVLKRFGMRVGQDLQHIRKECWHCNYWACDECEVTGDCCKCGGTNIYRQFWSRLDVYQLGGFRFHLPVERLYKDPGEPVTLTDYIQHVERGSYFLRVELLLWMIVIFDPVWLLRRIIHLRNVQSASPRYPLLWSLSQLGRFVQAGKRMAKRLRPPKKAPLDDIPF